MDDLQFLTYSQDQVGLAQPRRYWLVVACAEHVRRGQGGGFVQAGHGRAAPLRRLSPGDGVVCYSPSQEMAQKDGFQSFTAIGFIRPGDAYLADSGMFRRDIDWLEADDQPIRPLLDWLDFTQTPNWGYALRFGLIEMTEADFAFLQYVMTGAA
ncbi:EVE domain-containing protein [Asticcacaulis sp. EMRT-3]|uniref:EVE domain-containing protein n=1 Tax=Asticcacaulis sp. EMRT-3 TaxID=3040349 RepID=UPI0024AE90CD|nr:EVE domain-containing protein [Asticcacaulis sp. EMRT-3]MDI7776244.1 EVE domain-containing protein [Asticcacaulis sp. EMRT-3]